MLNEQQLSAVKTIDGSLLILAGAGTGKTTVLVNRIAEMLKQGIQARNILAITFTNKAAKELRERIEIQVGTKKAKEIWASTFHSMCIRILKSNARKTNKLKPGFTVYDEDNSLSVIKNILKDMGKTKEDTNPKNIKYAISMLKNEMVDADSYAKNQPKNPFVDWNKAKETMQKAVFEEEQELFEQVFSEYQKRLIKYNAVDFDDIILYTIDLFFDNEKVLEFYQNKFKYIMIDEYQDTNRAQYTLIKLLATRFENLGVVGDDAQSIYSFRSADYRNILNFGKDYPGAKIIKLEENYRSTKIILQAANEVISHNKNQYEKNLYTCKEDGEKITDKTLENEYQEAEYIAREIVNRVRNGKKYEDIAILSRTNSQSRPLEQEFIRRGIPYKLIGGVGFFRRKEIKDIVSYLNLLSNPDDVISFERIVNFPKRGVGPKTVTSIIAQAQSSSLSSVLVSLDKIKLTSKAKEGLEELVRNLSIHRNKMKTQDADVLLRQLIKDFGIMEALAEIKEDAEKKRDRKANISQLINMAADMVYRNEGKTLEDFIEIVSLYSDTDEIEDDNSVKVMTCHAAKGLEFDIVFGTGMEEGIFPHERSIAEGNSAIEEERRLFYVLITRAKEKLYLTNAESRRVFGEETPNKPSRFLSEFSFSLLE